MDLQLIEGEFSTTDGLELIVAIINTKIKFHENKICNSHHEEDIKSREKKIKGLQNSLNDIRIFLNTKNNGVKINALITIE